jgi:hypothetical protein
MNPVVNRYFYPAVSFFLFGPRLLAQNIDTVNEFWPEWQILISTSKTTRVMLDVNATKEKDVDYSNFEAGVHFDFFFPQFKHFLFRRLVSEDKTRNQMLLFRVGYRVDRSLNQATTVVEQRPLVEGTLRWVFPDNVLMSDRNRIEFRFINGSFSWRYRNELKFERDFRIARFPFTAYLSTEPFYDSRYRAWNRFFFTYGMVFPFRRRWQFEPYYTRQRETTPNRLNVNGYGVILSWFPGR